MFNALSVVQIRFSWMDTENSVMADLHSVLDVAFVKPRFSENYIRCRGTINPSIHYALREGDSEKMGSTTETKTVADDVKNTNGKVLEYLFYLEKQGRAKATCRFAS